MKKVALLLAVLSLSWVTVGCEQKAAPKKDAAPPAATAPADKPAEPAPAPAPADKPAEKK